MCAWPPEKGFSKVPKWKETDWLERSCETTVRMFWATKPFVGVEYCMVKIVGVGRDIVNGLLCWFRVKLNEVEECIVTHSENCEMRVCLRPWILLSIVVVSTVLRGPRKMLCCTVFVTLRGVSWYQVLKNERRRTRKRIKRLLS